MQEAAGALRRARRELVTFRRTARQQTARAGCPAPPADTSPSRKRGQEWSEAREA